MKPSESGLPEGSATTRKECRCPACLSYEGLEAIPGADQLYDDPIEKIVQASRCANDACPTDQVDPASIKKQIDRDELKEPEPFIDFEDFSIHDYIILPRNLIRSTSWRMIGVILLFVISAIFATLGGFGGGGGIVEAEDSYDGIEVADSTVPEAVYEDSNWTVYRSGDSYIVSGVIQGSIVFLTENGEVTDSPYRFDNSTAAKEAIALWRARNNQFPSEYSIPNATESLIDQVNWQVFSYNGSHIVAGKINDRPVFLQPNGEYTFEPYFYEIRGIAEQSILYWVALSQTNDLPAVERITASELQNILSDWDVNEEKFDVWNSTDLGNWTVYTNGSAYVAVASIDNETVYLRPDTTVSSSVANFDSATSLLQALSTWRDNNPEITPEPLSSSPDLGSEWESIDNQDAIADDLTSDELTTTHNDSISSGTGATIAGTVKDTNDQPISDATVTLHSDPQTTTTDSSGEFVFTGVPEGDHTIHVAPPDGADLAAPRNMSIHVNEAGEISTQSDPDNVLYFENDDGTISQNRLTFLTQKKQPIEVSGSGSDVSSTIQVANPSNIDGLEVALIPEYSATEKTKILNGTDTTDQLSINGSSIPQDQTIFLQSEIAQQQKTIQGTYTGSAPTIDPIGNVDPTDFTIELEGNKKVEQTEKTGTTTPSDSNAYTYDGNLEGSATITVKDNVQEIGEDYDSGTWSGGPINLPVEGNAPAKNVQITLTGQKGWTTTYSIRERQGGTGWDHHYDTSSTGHVDVGDTYKVYMSVSTSDQGDAEAEARASTPQEYLRADSGSYYTPDSDSTSYTGYISPSDDLYVQAAVDVWGDENDWYDSARATAKITLQRELPTQTVTLQGKDKTYEIGPLSNGETRTITIDEVPADGQIGVSTSGYPGFDYSASWTEQQAPEDISIQKNGNTIWSQNGVFYDSTQNISVSSLNPGDDINISPAIGATDYTVNANETSATQDPSLSVGGTTVFTHSGVFDKSQTVDVPSNLLSTEPTEFNISTSDGTMNWTANYTAQAAPTSTTIEIENESHVWPDDFSGSGALPLPSDDSPAQINISSLTTGEQTVSLQTEPVEDIETKAEATLVYDGNTKQSTDPEVAIIKPDGSSNTLNLPDSALDDGELVSLYETSIPAHWLGTGTNRVIVRTADDSVVSATVTTAGLEYQNKSLDYGS